MTRISYTEVSALPDAADQVAFALLLGRIPGVNSTQRLTIACLNVTIPGSQTEAYAVTLHGHTKKYRGRRMNAGTFTATFVEGGDHLIQRQLLQWKEYVAGYESGNSQGYLRDYSVLAQIVSYDTTGKVALRRNVTDVFPADVPDITHDGSASAAMNISVTFSFSRSFPIDMPLY